MSTVHPPSLNKLNGGYSSSHKAYDHDDIPDNRAFCSLKNASVVNVVDKYSSSWNQGKAGDPTPGGLTTEDYGNFVKLSGQDYEGNWVYQISAHLVKGIPVRIGQKLQMGEVIGTIGNNQTDTGNSTGGHLHTEYRNQSGTNIPVTFKQAEQPKEESVTYQQFYTKFMEAFKKHRDDIDWGDDKHKFESHGLTDEAMIGRMIDAIAASKKKADEDKKSSGEKIKKLEADKKKLEGKLSDSATYAGNLENQVEQLRKELAAKDSSLDPTHFSHSIAVLQGKADAILDSVADLTAELQKEKVLKAIEAQTEAIENLSQSISSTPTNEVPSKSLIQVIVEWLERKK